MAGSPQSDDSPLSDHFDASAAHVDPAALAERELDAALQLLVERAQYITGATGTALALPQGNEMVCRASAGACAPAVGARLQVRSGLTGESIVRRQLLRCDNAETDPRVNLETCRALGIASIVVLPLLRRNGQVRGLFELFSDHPYAFEERDLVALERMAALTLTALDLAEQRQDEDSVLPPSQTAKPIKPIPHEFAVSPTKEVSKPGPSSREPAPAVSLPQPTAQAVPSEPAPSAAHSTEGTHISAEMSVETRQLPPTASSSVQAARTPDLNAVPAASAAPVISPDVSPSVSPDVSINAVSPNVVEPEPLQPSPVPEAMRRVQKCSSCGFPVSEGRKLCLDCENLDRTKMESEKKARAKAALEIAQTGAQSNTTSEHEVTAKAGEPDSGRDENAIDPNADDPNAANISAANANVAADDQSQELPADIAPDEILPPFLTNPQLTEESWLARHVNLLVFLVLVACVLVAAVVFFR